MVWLKRLSLAAGLVLVALCFAGFLLPSDWHVERTRVVKAPPGVVTETLRRRDGWRRWMNLQAAGDPTFVFHDGTGPAKGVGMDFTWESQASGNGKVVVDAVEDGRLVAYSVILDVPPTTMRGEVRVVAEGDGSKLTWSESGSNGGDPWGRWMSAGFTDLEEATFDQNLDALQKIVESDAQEAAIIQGAEHP